MAVLRTVFSVLIILASVSFVSALGAAPEVSEDPAVVDARQFDEARTLFDASEYSRAALLLEELATRRPELGDVHRLLGHSYLRLNRLDAGRASLVKSIEAGRMTADIVAGLIQVDQARQRYEALLADLQLALMLEPDNSSWLLLLADTCAKCGQYDRAAHAIDRLLEREPLKRELWMRRGNLQLQAGRHSKAALSLETACYLGATEQTLPKTIAELWHSEGHLLSALVWYERILKSAPDAALELRIAELRYTMKDYAGAEAAARLLADNADDNIAIAALRLSGQCATLAERNADAESAWSRAVKRGLNDPSILAWLGNQAFKREDFDVAANCLVSRIDLGNASADLHVLLIHSLMKLKQKEQAEQRLVGYIAAFGYDKRARELILLLAT